MNQDVVVVTGAGGFIGGHLVGDLLASGFAKVRAVDCKPLSEWYQLRPDAENFRADLTEKLACLTVCDGALTPPIPPTPRSRSFSTTVPPMSRARPRTGFPRSPLGRSTLTFTPTHDHGSM